MFKLPIYVQAEVVHNFSEISHLIQIDTFLAEYPELQSKWRDCFRIAFKNYNRERNVHVFNFERVIGDNETHSGLDTRDGKLLRLELQFKDEPLLELKRKNNIVISTLRRGYSTMK